MPTIRFKAHGKWVEFSTKRAKAKAKPQRKRRGSWPKGKVPKHLKRFLFRKKARRSRR